MDKSPKSPDTFREDHIIFQTGGEGYESRASKNIKSLNKDLFTITPLDQQPSRASIKDSLKPSLRS